MTIVGFRKPKLCRNFVALSHHILKTVFMVFDLDLIRKIYAELPAKVAAARQLLGKPLTLTEKYYMLTCMASFLPVPIRVERIMWILHPTA